MLELAESGPRGRRGSYGRKERQLARAPGAWFRLMAPLMGRFAYICRFETSGAGIRYKDTDFAET